MKVTDALPEPYEEVFIWWNNNGGVVRRVARLNHAREYFQLSTYLDSTKGQYVAPLAQVERWARIVEAPAPAISPDPAGLHKKEALHRK